MSQNQPPQHDVYAQHNIPSNTANVTAAVYAHQMAASAAGGTAPYASAAAPYASAAAPYSGISAASIPDLYTGFPDYGLLSMTTGWDRFSKPSQPSVLATFHLLSQPAYIPGAICNWTLEQLTESTERPPQRRSAVIAAQHQSIRISAATSAAMAEPRTHRSPVTRRRQRQQQRHSESPEPALPRAFQPPCSCSTLLSSPPSSTPSSSASSSSSSSMHPALLAAATPRHHPMLLDMEQESRQYPAAVAMSSYRSATSLPVFTVSHHGQHPACTGATYALWSSVPLPACSIQHIPARGLVPPGNPAALQLPPPPTPRP